MVGPKELFVVYVRLGWVRHKVDILNGEEITIVSLWTQLEGRAAGDLQVLIDGDLVATAEVEAKTRMGDTGRDRDKCR